MEKVDQRTRNGLKVMQGCGCRKAAGSPTKGGLQLGILPAGGRRERRNGATGRIRQGTLRSYEEIGRKILFREKRGIGRSRHGAVGGVVNCDRG